ncbi:hypothetical protein CIK06_06190 [Plantactinospora sp. KBS50]|nr:hypothetical protein CIK06_06190 [Plantactinospora sp. KBS50]
MLAAFSFNTAESLPIGLLRIMSADLTVPLTAIGHLISGYGLTVALVSVPLAHWTRWVPRRHLLIAVLGTLLVASLVPTLVPAYPVLVPARVVTAVAQALFWSIMAPVATGMFPPEARGRVVGLLALGGTLAMVLGVPAGNWLGRQHGWYVPFRLLGLCALAALVVIALLLPTSPPARDAGAYGLAPDRSRFVGTLVAMTLAVTGLFTGFAYLVEVLPTAARFADGAVGLLLALFGLAGLCGVVVVGALLDRLPDTVLTACVLLQALALLLLAVAVSNQHAAVILLTVLGFAATPVFLAAQSRALLVAPGRTELALAANSVAYNVGVALGTACGGVALRAFEARGTFLVGGTLSAAALLVLLAEPAWTLGRRRGADRRADPAPRPRATPEHTGTARSRPGR